MFTRWFGSCGDRRAKREKSFRPQLECLESRTMLDAGLSVGLAPPLTSQKALMRLSTDFAKLAFDMTKADADGVITANVVFRVANLSPPPPLEALLPAAIVINASLKDVTLMSGTASLFQDLQKGNMRGAVLDAGKLLNRVSSSFASDMRSVAQDMNTVSRDITMILFPPPPAPTPAPAKH